MEWKVKFSKKADKRLRKLPNKIRIIPFSLSAELELSGPVMSNWPNYGKLKGTKKILHHCHLIKGKPTYVACWEVLDKSLKQIEVYYVGTHENAPY